MRACVVCTCSLGSVLTEFSLRLDVCLERVFISSLVGEKEKKKERKSSTAHFKAITNLNLKRCLSQSSSKQTNKQTQTKGFNVHVSNPAVLQ